MLKKGSKQAFSTDIKIYPPSRNPPDLVGRKRRVGLVLHCVWPVLSGQFVRLVFSCGSRLGARVDVDQFRMGLI